MPIGIASSRSRVPPERSRSVVTLVTRNITMKGNIASSAGPIRSNVLPGRSSNIHHSRLISRHGSTSMIARVRWSRRSWVSTRAAMAKVMRGFMPPLLARSRGTPARCRLLGPAAFSLISVGVPSAMNTPSRIRSSRSQRSASSMTWLETSTATPVSARSWNVVQRSSRSTGSSPTVGSSSTSMLGLPSRATARLARDRCPPLSWATTSSAWSPRSTVSMQRATSDLSTPSTRAKNARFSVTLRSSYTLGAWVT